MRPPIMLTAAILAAGIGSAAAEAETTWRIAGWLPPTHPLTTEVMRVWARQVTDATQSRVNPRLLAAPLGPPAAHFDLVANGVADVAYGVHNYTAGRFPTAALAELPFLSDSARDLSIAYWRVYRKYLARAGERPGVRILSVFTCGPGHLYTTGRAVASVEDLRGLKLRVGGGIAQRISDTLGVVTVQTPATEAYEVVANGVVDGVLFPAEAIASFKLHEAVRHGTLFPGGLYNASFFLAVNQAKWDGLSERDRAAILEVSGESFARLAGEAWDRADARARLAMRDAGVVERPAPGPMIEAVRSATRSVVDRTLAAVGDQGVDAAAVYRMLLAELVALRAERQP